MMGYIRVFSMDGARDTFFESLAKAKEVFDAISLDDDIVEYGVASFVNGRLVPTEVIGTNAEQRGMVIDMKINEIKETKEVVVRTEYIANDGTKFTDKEECVKYENTCKCVIMSAYKELVVSTVCEYGLYDECGSEEFYYDMVEIKDASDLETVNKALKFNYTNAKLLDSSNIGKIVLVGKDYDMSLTGYSTTIDKIVDAVKKNYQNALDKKEPYWEQEENDMNGAELINKLVSELGRAKEMLRDLNNGEESVNDLIDDIRADINRYHDVADNITALLKENLLSN